MEDKKVLNFKNREELEEYILLHYKDPLWEKEQEEIKECADAVEWWNKLSINKKSILACKYFTDKADRVGHDKVYLFMSRKNKKLIYDNEIK
jgi:hypothetical protein